MKTSIVFLFCGLASATSLASASVQSLKRGENSTIITAYANITSSGNSVNLSSNADQNGGSSGSLDLGDLNVDGLNLGSIDLNNQDEIMDAILIIMQSLCLGDLVSGEGLLSLGASNDLDLFLELAQLLQLEELGVVSFSSIQSLVEISLLSGDLDFGVIKREAAEAKKSARRVRKIRRKVTARDHSQCYVGRFGMAKSVRTDSSDLLET